MSEEKTMVEKMGMGKLGGLRVVEIPKFRAVSSGSLPFDKIFTDDGFGKWQGEHKHLIKDSFYAAPDFMWHDQEGYATWIWAVKDDVTANDCKPYKLIEFKGGMYAVATADEKDNADISMVVGNMMKWINESEVFEMDVPPRYGMGHMIGVGLTEILGWAQQEIFLPIKYKK